MLSIFVASFAAVLPLFNGIVASSILRAICNLSVRRAQVTPFCLCASVCLYALICICVALRLFPNPACMWARVEPFHRRSALKATCWRCKKVRKFVSQFFSYIAGKRESEPSLNSFIIFSAPVSSLIEIRRLVCS